MIKVEIKPTDSDFVKRLKAFRAVMGFSQQNAGNLIKCQLGTWSLWEAGLRRPMGLYKFALEDLLKQYEAEIEDFLAKHEKRLDNENDTY